MLLKKVLSALVATGAATGVALVLSSGASPLSATPTVSPADQIALNGACVDQPTVIAAAESAISSWVANPSQGPAAVMFDGQWVPAMLVLSNPTGPWDVCPPYVATRAPVAPVVGTTTTTAAPTTTTTVATGTTATTVATTTAPTATTVAPIATTTTTNRDPRCSRWPVGKFGRWLCEHA